MEAPLHIVGLGGTLRPGSTTERLVALCLEEARARGATTEMLDGAMLTLPLYQPGVASCPQVTQLIAALRRADAVVLGAPGYHGSLSGLMKNALDYIEEMSGDASAYLEGRAVLNVATAGGWQGACAALGSLRNITHALRGWPTPLGIAVNTSEPVFDETNRLVAPGLAQNIAIGVEQLLTFVRAHQPLVDDRMVSAGMV